MSKWKDKKRFYTDENPCGSKIMIGKERLSIHRHMDYPKDIWFCSSIFFTCEKLKSKDFEEAKKEALEKFEQILTGLISAVDEIRGTPHE